MSVAQDKVSQVEEQPEEGRSIREEGSAATNTNSKTEDISGNSIQFLERDFEGGFGGQEDLEDRFATTSGEH